MNLSDIILQQVTKNVAGSNIQIPQNLQQQVLGGLSDSILGSLAKTATAPGGLDQIKGLLTGQADAAKSPVTALAGNIFAPFVFLLAFNIPNYLVRWFGIHWGYKMGTDFLAKAEKSGIMQKVFQGAAMIGLIVIGGMVASMVTVKLGWTIGSGDGAIDLNSVLDGIMPKMLPLAVTFALSKALGKGAKVKVKGPDGEKFLDAEKILVAVGRGPNTKDLGLDKAGITVKDGFIQTNEKQETNVPGVYAVGDCTGKLMLAHAAMAMGEVAAENAMGGDRIFKPEMSPSCAYVGPEFAGVGYTEERAKELGIAYKVGKFPTSGSGRSLVAGHTDGMIKILAGEKDGEILGVHILAPSATELIEEAALAIKLECTVKEFVETIHCHPTVAESVREAALNIDKKAIHIPNK